MRKLIILLICSFSILAKGQNLNFRQVDSTSYNQYIHGDWKNLIATGKEALDNNIDYYYLQMRMAYSYFSLGKYRQASVYYKNALHFNSSDAVANEYLYYSYLYSGRSQDALLVAKSLTGLQKTAMNIKDTIKIIAFGFSYAESFSNADQVQDAISSGTTIKEGVQKATFTMRSPKVSLSHKIGNHIRFDHNFSLVNKSELSYAIVNNTEYFSPVQPLKQTEYNLNAEITIFEGLTFKPGLHYMNSVIPLYEETSYGMNAGQDRIPVSEVRLSNWASVFQIEKRMPYFDIGISYVNHNYNSIGSNQLGFHATAFPLSNLNFYFTLDAYIQFLSYKGESISGYIYKPLIGFKLHKNFWLEITGTIPEQFNFYDVRNTIAFNNIEKSSYSLEVYGIIPLYKSGVNLFLGYQNRGMNSYYFLLESMLDPINKQSYNTHLITGGITWTL